MANESDYPYRNKLFKAYLLIFVGVTRDDPLRNLSHLVPWQRETGLSKELLQFEIADITAVVEV